MTPKVFQNADVRIDSQLFSKVRAVPYDERARLFDSSGEMVAEMFGEITVSDVLDQSETWSNGTEVWLLENAGCNCHGN